MNDKGAALNQRVWTLFEKAGFETKPNSQDSSEEVVILSAGKERKLDLSASVPSLGVKIVGENTTASNLGGSFTTYVHDFQTLMKKATASAGLFVFTNRDTPDADKQYASKAGIQVWSEAELSYYEAVVDAIGEYAKYEIIHSFGIQTIEEQNVHPVLALRFNQPDSGSDADLFLFTLHPEKLLKTCIIFRKAQGSGKAYQRMLKKERLRRIGEFVSEKGALLPPNIIVYLGDKITWTPIETPTTDTSGRPIHLAMPTDYELVILNIPLRYASMELIDGQHRLYGFVKAAPSTRKNFNLVVLGMAKLPLEARRDTFVAINDKSRRVDPNLVAYLKYTKNEAECQKDSELMAIKIVVELNKMAPFKDRIRLLDVGHHKITLKGFAGYDLKGLVGDKGLLHKYYRHESSEYVSALRLYFNILKSLFEEQWNHPEKYIIFTNSGISAFLKLLKSLLKTCKCPLDKRIVGKYLQPLRDKWKDSDLETKNLAQTLRSTYVGSKGWKDLHRLFVSTIYDVHPEFEE